MQLRCRDYCAGTNYDPALTRQYVCGDFRLGPTRLPTRLPLSDLIDDYRRFGGLCPGSFLEQWWNLTTKSYNYPVKDGFQIDSVGNPIKGMFVLEPGIELDRFGGEGGKFLSPRNAPYNQRSLPPLNLDTPPDDRTYPYNYHVYRVLKSLTVTSGPIAGWFGQPGQGVQYQISQTVAQLLADNFIERVKIRRGF
ncbi:hypothetical protein B0O99DRAFT_528286 [Bisporella sp. PMI_857]|nr:hypothetical protein B0O99DRAFT_528286 [Bisporella sp. PMI_857]